MAMLVSSGSSFILVATTGQDEISVDEVLSDDAKASQQSDRRILQSVRENGLPTEQARLSCRDDVEIYLLDLSRPDNGNAGMLKRRVCRLPSTGAG